MSSVPSRCRLLDRRYNRGAILFRCRCNRGAVPFCCWYNRRASCFASGAIVGPFLLPTQLPRRPVFVSVTVVAPSCFVPGPVAVPLCCTAGAIVAPIFYMANVTSGGCGIPFCPRKCRLRLLVGVRARVRRGIYALQLRDVVVGVDLCCLEGGVAHQLLYFAQVGAVVEQVCGEGVP